MPPSLSSLLLVLLLVAVFSNITPTLASYTKGVASIVTFKPGQNTNCGASVANDANGIVVPKSFWNSIPGSQGGHALCGKCVRVIPDTAASSSKNSATVRIVSFCDNNCGSGPNDVQLTAKTFKTITGSTTGTSDVKYTYSPYAPDCES